MSDNEVASMPEEAVDGPLDPAAVAALTAPVPETIGDGGPELVQLLTPEGERVEHPDVRRTSPTSTTRTCAASTATWS